MKENTLGNIETEQLIKMAEDFLQKQSFETDHPLRAACADFYNKDSESRASRYACHNASYCC